MKTISAFKVLIAIENAQIRESVIETLSGLDCNLNVIARADDLRYALPDGDLLFLETNDDVASLTQIVYEMYRTAPPECRLLILGILSENQVRLNPQVSVWLINGHAALFALLTTDQPRFSVDVAGCVSYLSRDRSQPKTDHAP